MDDSESFAVYQEHIQAFKLRKYISASRSSNLKLRRVVCELKGFKAMG